MTQHSSESALTETQYDELLETALGLNEPFDAECAFILVSGGRLGMRAGEIAHCRESWVNWNRSIIEIPSYDPCDKGEDGGPCGYCRQCAQQSIEYDPTLNYQELLNQRWNPKTENSARAIPFDFDDEVEEIVRAFFDEYDRYESSRASINRRVDRVLEAAGYPTDMCYPHALRATAATYHAYRGLSAVPLQSLFGWNDVATSQKYIRLSGGATRDALHEVHSDD